MPDKQYVVLNPRRVPDGKDILSYEDHSWNERDIFAKPRKMTVKDVESLIKRGFLQEVG